MRGILFLPFALLISGSLSDRANGNFKAISEHFNEFAKDLYKEIAQHEEGNFVFSPISVSILLSMLAIGSNGETRKQVTNVLHFRDNWELEHKATKPLLERLNGYSKIDLKLANKIFLSNLFNLDDRFKYVTQSYFNASAQTVDFADEDNTSKQINDWCQKQTNSKIKDMVTPSDLSPETVMMLLNAVYFKANWEEQFNESETDNLPFMLQDGTIKEIPTMYHHGYYGFGQLEHLNATFLRIPYENADENDDLSMYIIIPKFGTDLTYIEKHLSELDLKYLSDSYLDDFHVFIPRFKVDSKVDLNTPLKELGLTDIFDSRADFPYLVTSGNVVVSKVAQKAFLEVNEGGSEAAAVTELDYFDKMPPGEFHADRPFISLIATKNSILFMSRIVEP